MRLQRRRSDRASAPGDGPSGGRSIAAELRSAARLAERLITPARGVAVVALVATITLGASQFRDYRAVRIDSPSHAAVENPPAPERDKRSPRSAHGLTVLGIAVAAFFVTALAIGGRWRLARLLTVLGIAVILISLLVDAPEGLREGLDATLYEGAQATLLGGFWAQLASGVTLAVSGPLLAVYLREGRATGRERQRRPRRSVPAGTVGAGPGAEGAAGGTARW